MKFNSIIHTLAVISVLCCDLASSKIIGLCEFAVELYKTHEVSRGDIYKHLCIAKMLHSGKESSTDNSGFIGIYGIGSEWWCGKEEKGGGCNVKCSDLVDDDIADDIKCASLMISQQGIEAWSHASEIHCKSQYEDKTNLCLENEEKIEFLNEFQPNNVTITTTSEEPVTIKTTLQEIPNEIKMIATPTTTTTPIRKEVSKEEICDFVIHLYETHELAQDEIYKHLCIANLLHTKKDGGGFLGIYGIGSEWWCGKEEKGGGCDVKCSDLLDDDITDDVRCAIKILSDLGMKAWHASESYCKSTHQKQVDSCLEDHGFYDLATEDQEFVAVITTSIKPRIIKNVDIAEKQAIAESSNGAQNLLLFLFLLTLCAALIVVGIKYRSRIFKRDRVHEYENPIGL